MTTPTTNDQQTTGDGQDGAPPPDNGHQADDGDDGQPDNQPDDGDQSEDDGDDPGNKARREAKSLRDRLRATETERTEAVARADAADAAILSTALEAAGLSAVLWKAAEVNADELRSESGVLDHGAIVAAAQQVRRDAGLGGPAPNPQQGSPSGAAGQSFVDAFDTRNARARRR